MNGQLLLSELLNLVFYYTIKMEIIDINIVNKIIETVGNTLEISPLINSIYIDEDKNLRRLSGYDVKNKDLYINYKRILSFVTEVIKHRNLYNNLEEKIFEINLMILKIILHELEQVYQVKMLEDVNSTLENMLLKISYEPFIDFSSDLTCNEVCYLIDFKRYLDTSRGYTIDPAERYACIKASNTICNILEELQGFDIVKEYATRDLNRELLSGYMNLEPNVISPTEEFLKNQKRILLSNGVKRDNQNLLELIDREYDLSLRLYHGLKIDKSEYLIYKNRR